MGEPFLLGVNYWPRRKAMYWWSDFDAGEVREEFALISDLGLSLVRIFLLWDDFQPDPKRIDLDALAHLETVCEIAAESQLSLDVTFFTGHMSGPNWAPRWLLSGSPRPNALQLVSGGRVVESGYLNPFTDPTALAAERLLLSSVVNLLARHPAIGIWNLGNEPDLFAHPPDAATGRAWVREMAGLVHSIDPIHPVTCGLHVASLLQDNGLRVNDVFSETDLAVMHSYPMYVDWARSPLDPEVVPFTCALTTALCGKRVLMEEFGGSTTAPGERSHFKAWVGYGRYQRQFMAAEEDLAEYLVQVLPRLLEVGATGALLWCFADYIPELWDQPPCLESMHERFFGLVRPDGCFKPHAQVIRDFAKALPEVSSPTRKITLTMSPDEFYGRAYENTVKSYRDWTRSA